MDLNSEAGSKADYEALMEQAAKQIEAVRDMSAQLAEVRGEAEAADGKVRVTVRQGGSVDAIELDPRAMKLQSHELSEAIVEASHAATEDVNAKLKDLLETALPGAGESIVSMTDPEAIEKEQAVSEERVNSIIESLRRGM